MRADLEAVVAVGEVRVVVSRTRPRRRRRAGTRSRHRGAAERVAAVGERGGARAVAAGRRRIDRRVAAPIVSTVHVAARGRAVDVARGVDRADLEAVLAVRQVGVVAGTRPRRRRRAGTRSRRSRVPPSASPLYVNAADFDGLARGRAGGDAGVRRDGVDRPACGSPGWRPRCRRRRSRARCSVWAPSARALVRSGDSCTGRTRRRRAGTRSRRRRRARRRRLNGSSARGGVGRPRAARRRSSSSERSCRA